MEKTKGLLSLSSKKITVKGKFLYNGGQKFYIKGVTYGTFRPNTSGSHFPSWEIIEKDFAMMKAHGFNAIRTYTVPPPFFFSLAEKYNLKVMVGLPWEQHITFLDDPKRKNEIIERVKKDVAQCNGHNAILCFAIGNEIPAPIVRWYGKKRIESFLKQLYKAVKHVDGDTLVTYVNYPTTEYLDLSFLDFDCFNVYLETPEKLSAYLSRLHNLSGDRPLVLAEIGLDSFRNGTQKQAEVLSWQVETIFAKGCAGMFVFAWTDEWWRGGFDIEDWDFGLVERSRDPKPALYTVSKAMAGIPFTPATVLPHITVIICTHNGSATIRESIEEILKLDYPNFDVVVINDGSTDETRHIVKKYPVKLITTTNRGLSAARNTGMYNATGEIIAYIDDDAYPDPQWLKYLAHAYLNSDHGCIGGPNIAPADDGFLATCVANAPGGPVHVLESDEIAEHVPGCNMSFRKDALMKIGGFDPIYRAAGDDVDVCWRIQQLGRTVGFHPAAVVWHHRRNSLKAYWRQQKGYGKAEALLEAKWPGKYNGIGHLSWAGRIYGNGFTLPLKLKKERIFHGTWGSALFQSVYQPSSGFINSIPLMPEWYLLSAFMGILGCFGFLWRPLLWIWPLFFLSILVVVVQAIASARKNSSLQPHQKKIFKYTFLIVLLHMVQPVARLYGRFANGLTPWRKRGALVAPKFLFAFRSRIFTHWSEDWRSAEEWLSSIEKNLIEFNARIKRGDDFSRWDIQVRTGLFIKSRGLLTIEEHGAGKQFLRFKCTSSYPLKSFVIPAAIALTGGMAFIAHQYIIMSIMAVAVLFVAFRCLIETARGMNTLYSAFQLLSSKTIDATTVILKDKLIKDDANIPPANSKHLNHQSLKTNETGIVMKAEWDIVTENHAS